MVSVQSYVVNQSEGVNKRQAVELHIPNSVLLKNIVPFMDNQSMGRVRETSEEIRGLLSAVYSNRKHQVLCSQSINTFPAKKSILESTDHPITEEEMRACMQFVNNTAHPEQPSYSSKNTIYTTLLDCRYEQTNTMAATEAGFTCLTDEILYKLSVNEYDLPLVLSPYLKNSLIHISENTLIEIIGDTLSETLDDDLELVIMIMKHRLEPTSNRILQAIDDRIMTIAESIEHHVRLSDYLYEDIEVSKLVTMLDQAASTFNEITNNAQNVNFVPIELPQHVQTLISAERNGESGAYWSDEESTDSSSVISE